MTNTNTRIALTNLGKYNEGELVYKWLDLPYTDAELEAAKTEIGINDEYEEWFITDCETDIDGLEISEYADIDDLNDLISDLERMEEYEVLEVKAIIEANGYDLKEAIEKQQSGDCTLYVDCDTLEDLAQQFFDDGLFGDPQKMGTLANYIDFERLGRDLGFDGYTVTQYGVIYCA